MTGYSADRPSSRQVSWVRFSHRAKHLCNRYLCLTYKYYVFTKNGFKYTYYQLSNTYNRNFVEFDIMWHCLKMSEHFNFFIRFDFVDFNFILNIVIKIKYLYHLYGDPAWWYRRWAYYCILRGDQGIASSSVCGWV